MDVNVLRFYFDKSKEAKAAVTPIYNEVLQYTDSTYQIVDTNTKNLIPSKIDSIIPTSLSDLVSFLMSSMISRGSPWATITMNKELYSLVEGGDQGKFASDQKLVELNRELEQVSSATYTYLNQSNYYSEISRALRECVNIGTGAYRVTEKDDPVSPFTFQYLPLDDLFFWEDAFGRPFYIFRYIRNINQKGMELMFGDKIKAPKSVKNKDTDLVDLLEVCYPSEKDDKKFMYEVYDEGMNNKLYEIELDYCPIVVFRWSKEGTNPNGLGLSIKGLKDFEDLKNAKEKRAESADKLLNPPLFLNGDRALAQAMSLKAKAVNFAGQKVDKIGNPIRQEITVQPIQTVGSLLPVDQDIMKYEASIRELYTSNPLGQVGDYKRRSATESQIRLNALRQKWALSFESLERELLMPTFMTPLKILMKKKKVDFEASGLDTTMIVYKNALALSQDSQNVEMVNVYIQQSLQAIQYAQQTGLKIEKVLPYFQRNLGLPLELAMSEEELETLKQELANQQSLDRSQIQQQQQNELRQQQLDQDKTRLEIAEKGM